MMQSELEKIFGPESKGATAPERARTSKRLFIRSQDHLGVYGGQEGPGRILSAWESLQSFGMEPLREAVVDGTAIIVSDSGEPATTIRLRREGLGLSIEQVAAAASLSTEVVNEAENTKKRTSIRALEKIALVLGLDERLLSWKKGSGGDSGLAIRLKTLITKRTVLSPSTVMALNEAAWVIATQNRLLGWAGSDLATPSWKRFEPSDNYGGMGYPSWQHGIYLAQQARKILGIDADIAIDNMRELCERRLGIPIVQCDLPDAIAGATILNQNTRGIAVNTRGANKNVWVRRATLAHELGHLLWDPEKQLSSLGVDDYDALEQDARDVTDYVEQRANAFAVEFLAPQDKVSTIYKRYPNQSDGVRSVMEELGVSYTVARYQIWNSSDRSIRFDSLRVKDFAATEDWTAREAFAEYFFTNTETPLNRRGLFSGIVVKTEMENLISEDTAATYLGTQRNTYHSQRATILDLFPIK